MPPALGLIGLVLLSLLAALPPMFLVPPTTKSDETYHWAYAAYLGRTGSLPPYISPDDPTSREAHQPPLYYFLAAALTHGAGGPAAFGQHIRNPFFLGTAVGNRNLDILGPDALRSFWPGRWLSLLFWILLPVLAAWAWRPLLGPRRSLAAAYLLPLIPLLPFVGTSYSNDLPSVTFMALAFGALVRLLDRDDGKPWPWSLLLGLALGCSMLSKLYALPLVGAIGAVAVAPFVSLDRRRRFALVAALALMAVMLVPWFWSNQQRFGNPLAMSVFSDVMGSDPHWYRPDKLLNIAGLTWRTFWGDVGPGGIDAIPQSLAVGLAVLELAALAGAIRRLRSRRSPQPRDRYRSTVAVLLALWVLLALASFVWTFARAQVMVVNGGRNLLYLHLANVPLLVFGLGAWPKPRRAAYALPAAAGALLTGWAVVTMLALYPVAPVTRSAVPPAAPLARFGDRYALVSWDVRPDGAVLHVSFTLAKLGQDDAHHAYFLQIVTPANELLANVNTYPAHGMLSTAYLAAGTEVHEEYDLSAGRPPPPGTRVLLGLWTPPAADERLPAFDARGHPLPDNAFAVPWPVAEAAR